MGEEFCKVEFSRVMCYTLADQKTTVSFLFLSVCPVLSQMLEIKTPNTGQVIPAPFHLSALDLMDSNFNRKNSNKSDFQRIIQWYSFRPWSLEEFE